MLPGPAIIDTNVVVAGLLTKDASAPTARILDGMIQGQLIFVVSTELVANAIVRDIATHASHAPDPGDQHLWDLLASMPIAVLVTGDRALRAAASAGSSVLPPRAWVDAAT